MSRLVLSAEESGTLQVRPGEDRAFHSSYKKEPPWAAASGSLGGLAAAPAPLQPQPGSHYAPPAEALIGLRRKASAGGGSASAAPARSKAFLPQCSFWKTARGQAALLRWATLLPLSSSAGALSVSLCSAQGQRRRTVAHRASWNSLRRWVLLGWVRSRLFWEAAVQGLGTAAPELRSANARGWVAEGCQSDSSTVLTCAQQPGLKWPARQVSGSFQSLECPQMPGHVVLPNAYRPPSRIQSGQSLPPDLCRPTRK